MDDLPMLEKRTWSEFRASGLAWWVNRLLHTFGWALVFEVDDHQKPEEEQKILACYPARCKFRGFDAEAETRGFDRLTRHLEESLPRLKADIKT